MRQFFTENNNRLSMMRLISLLLVVGGISLAFVHPDYETGYLGMILIGVTGKAGQKIVEEKLHA